MKREKPKKMVTLISSKSKQPLIRSVKDTRNLPCRCGSGKKTKKCCGNDYEKYYSNKLPTKNVEECES